MKKILHLGLKPILSGVQNVMLQILDALSKSEEYDIYVASAPNGPLVQEVEKRGWTHIPIHNLVREINPKKDLLAIKELTEILKNGNFDVLHTHSSKTGLLGRVIGTKIKIPKIIHTVHGFAFHKYQNPILYYSYLLIEKIAANYCNFIVSVNNEDAIFLIDKLRVPANKVKFIANGETAKKPLNILTKKEITVGTMSRFWKQKNMISTVKMAINSCKHSANLKFIFVGDGDDLQKCKRLIKTANLENRIILPGWSSDKDYWLKQFDIFILYSLWEGLPLSILEAMSYGLPIIASDIKGNRELVDDSNGVLVPIEKPYNLVRELAAIDKNRDVYRKKGISSLKKINEKFSQKSFNEGYLKLYKEN